MADLGGGRNKPPADERAPYRLRVAGPAVRALTRGLPEKIAAAVYEFINGPLLDHPHRVRKPLDPPVDPAYAARRGTYRVLYLIDDERRIVEVTAVRHRADAYHS